MELNHKIYGEGQPIVVLHGLFGMLDNWLTVAKELSEDFMVVLVDLRNHGKSPHSEEWNVSLMADDVIELLHENWIYECIMVGHSMGGKVAMDIALKENDLVEKLIVVDIAPKEYPRGHDSIFKALQSVPIEEIGSRTEAQEGLQEFIPEIGVQQFLLKNLSRKKEGGYKWKMNLNVIIDNYESILAETKSDQEFSNPTLFVRGSRSNYILDEDKVLIESIFPKYKLETIKDAGHWIHADKKDELILSFRNFIQ